MAAADLGKRFLESTRGQIVSLLRRGARTVEELARSLGLTDNAVRNHLATLERDGLVRPDGVRRPPGVGKPAVLYEVRPEAEPLFSRAYPPVLAAVVDVLGGAVDVVIDDGALQLRSHGCPLSAAVARRPEVCRAVETLVGEIVGAPVRECCERGARPRCRFAVGAA